MATPNSNILSSLEKIQDITNQLMAVDFSSLTEDQIHPLQELGTRLSHLAASVQTACDLALPVSERELLEECQRELDIWTARKGIPKQTLEFSRWIECFSAEPDGYKLMPTVSGTLEWLRKENQKSK